MDYLITDLNCYKTSRRNPKRKSYYLGIANRTYTLTGRNVKWYNDLSLAVLYKVKYLFPT